MNGLVVIDMPNDFVTGPIGTPRAESIGLHTNVFCRHTSADAFSGAIASSSRGMPSRR